MVKSCNGIEIIKNLRGGLGSASIQRILSGKDRLHGVSFLGIVTLEPGSSIGYHSHHGEGEIYYLLSGKGKFFTSETETVEVKKDDLTYIFPESGHGIINDSQETMVLLAIVYEMIHIEEE